MNKSLLPEIYYLIIILFVSIGVMGFSWYYVNTVQSTSSAVRVALRPMVLGAYAERQPPVEEPLAGTPIRPDNSALVKSAMLLSDVNFLYQNYCRRDAQQYELEHWVAKNSNELENTLKSDCANN